MKARLMFASVFTMGMLLGFVATIVLLVMFFAEMINPVALIALTIVFNILAWLISPFIQDLVLRWFYACEAVEWPQFQQQWPNLAKSIELTCSKHKVPLPKMRIIDDGNPTAYCFGSGPWNSRLVATKGLFKYLDENEVTAVYHHELGHIVNRDFIVMTIAATLLTVLYELYVVLSRMKKGSKNPLPMIGYISYVFYVIGSYLVLYLSRTREYLADRFAAEETRNPNWLAMGLVKVAYGIAAAPDSEKSKRLLASTRALGLYDYKSADATGSAFSRLVGEGGGAAVAEPPPKTGSSGATGAADRVERVFLFDLFNPWAKVGEFNSTHPLTGKRIKKLMEYCEEFGVAPKFDFSLTSYEGQMLDRGRLYRNFAREVLVYFAPAIGFVLGLAGALFVWQTNKTPTPIMFAPLLGLGLGWSLQGMYRFPGGEAERTTVFELMCDPYASPVRGRLVYLEGQVVGRVQAGSPVGEDMTLHDRSGGLISLNYESLIPVLGTLWFGWRRVANLMNEQVSAIGWFRRYTTAYVDLSQMKAANGTIESYTRFWGLWRGPVFILLALVLMAGLRSL